MVSDSIKNTSNTVMKTSQEKYVSYNIDRAWRKIGESKTVERFIRKIGKPTTQSSYLIALSKYFQWLREKGADMDPDQLIRDNLQCIYGSGPSDVETKRKHTDWLDEYVNRKLLEAGSSESSRMIVSSAIKQFYKRNDSPLFGDFSVSIQQMKEPPKPLEADDIRKVLKALPLSLRTPLLLAWQSGIEIGRVLSLTWRQVENIDSGECPLKINLYGRKRHRKTYFSFVGKDSIEHLKMWRGKWPDLMGRNANPEDLIFVGKQKASLSYTWLELLVRRTASSLAGQCIIKNGNIGSWHPHALRHSFETEASHAGVKSEIRDYFLGHITGIQWTYNHRDEIHPEDLVKEYLKIEPYVSLDYTDKTLREEYDQREKNLIERILQLERLYSDLKKEVLSRP
ncbi:MAG: tyrosine-type recombinase/integrase [Nitrososphaeria archaeon]|jgi:integrase